MVTLSTRAYGAGIILLACVCLAFGNFDFGQSVPKDFPARTALAYAAAVFMLAAGLAIQFPRTVHQSAAALALYFGIFVVILMDGRLVVAHYAEYVIYSSVAAQLAVAAGATIIHGRFVRAAQVTFGLCAVLFGGAHFLYMNLTAPLVPRWLPASGEFWGYATGVAHITAGIAIATACTARLAAILLAVMYASFTPLVHLPIVIAKPFDHYAWSENALNILLAAVAWVVADSLARPRPPAGTGQH
jgi:uncharacterized membrane protein